MVTVKVSSASAPRSPYAVIVAWALVLPARILVFFGFGAPLKSVSAVAVPDVSVQLT